MGALRKNTAAVLLGIVLSLVSLVWSTPGAVVCVARDHLAIETAEDNKCASAEETPGAAARFLLAFNPCCQGETECGSCLDIPLGRSIPALLSGSKHRGAGIAGHADALPARANPVHPDRFHACSWPDQHGHPQSRMAALYASVLLI